ncbi:MAG: agmatine deiminase family protein [Xanthobacteraceae bacterium]|nr:agmatine deiminase family protein [Xanthobacteraceae bacterium]
MNIRIPAEWEPHACCWLAWAVHNEWGKARNAVKRALSEVIQTIARFEPVRVLARRGPGYREARREFAACGNVTVIEAPVDDFWMRDIMPTFAWRGEGPRELVAIDWTFNGWGDTEERPRRSGDDLAREAAAIFGTPRVTVPFVAEGGALVTDGRGTLITTRSCLLNPNRNPMKRGIDRQRMIETEMTKFGMRRVIWLEGDPCEPITSGHTDGYVLFAPGGKVLVETIDDPDSESPLWRAHDVALLEEARDAIGRRLKVVQVRAARHRYWKYKSESFAACYLNAYVTNGAVVGAKFGDAERDEAARLALAIAFPGREIIMLRIDPIANGGGGVHCLTQPMPDLAVSN